MKYKKYFKLLIALVAFNAFGVSQNTLQTPPTPISHCYHWLDQKNRNYLDYKYRYARSNNGDVTFYTIPGQNNGAIAGPGLYCAKTPTSSFSYGDRVIRLDLVDDIVILDYRTGRKYCGHNGNYYANQAQCDAKPWDIKFYTGGGPGSKAWYVIRDPQAIAKWSANSNQLEADLNLNKAGAGYSYITHADNTINAMIQERQRIGTLEIVNHKARMNLIDILNDPVQTNKIPPLSIIARVVKYTGNDLSDSRKKSIYSEQFLRALKDNQLGYEDFKSIIDDNSSLTPILVKQAHKNMSSDNLKDTNVVASLIIIDEFSQTTLSNYEVGLAWKSIFESNNIFSSLLSHTFKHQNIITGLFNNLPAVDKFDKISNPKKLELLQFLLSQTDEKSKIISIRPLMLATIENFIINSPQYVAAIYGGHFDQQDLGVTDLTRGVLAKYSAENFSGKDPIALGTIIDLIAGSLTDDQKTQYIDQIKVLDLPLNDIATYKLLGDFSDGDFKLPSMFTEIEYFNLLTKRSILERGRNGISTKTNTYRLILSAFFEYFHDLYRKNKDDDNKKQAIQVLAEKTFINIARNLQGDQLYSYGYAALQNASYFSPHSSLKYDVHPLEKYFDYYQTGDTSFDNMLEALTKVSTDGSYLHALIYLAADRDKQKLRPLLDSYIQSLISDEMSTYISSSEYTVANKEKEDWRNFIDNRHIQNAGRNRTMSNFCGIALVLRKFRRTLSSEYDQATQDKFKAIIDSEKNAGCRIRS